ncbi:hypothetical protein DWW17_13475, partial [Bacteroides sp. AF14-46]
EERTKKRRRGYRAFGFVAAVAVGVCGTRFVRTVLAHFSSVFLATSPPDKGGIGGSCLYSNPLALWALPLYSLVGTQGERGLTLLLPLQVFLIPLLVATLLSSPLYFALHNAGEEGDSNPPLIAVRYPAYGARQGGV